MARQKRRSAWSSRDDRIVAPSVEPRNRAWIVAGGAASVILLVFLISYITAPKQQSSDPPAVFSVHFDEPFEQGGESHPDVGGEPGPDSAPPSVSPTTPPRPAEVAGLQPKTPVAQTSHPKLQNQGIRPSTSVNPLVEDDWKIGEQVGVDAPIDDMGDEASISPQMLANHEDAVRARLESIDPMSLSPEQMDNIRSIALGALDPQTKNAAIQALGINHSDQSQRILRELFDSTMDLQAKDQILGHIRPASMGDPNAQWLLMKLGAPGIPDQIQQQIVVSLVGTTVGPGGKNNPADLETLTALAPPQYRDQIAQAYQKLTHN